MSYLILSILGLLLALLLLTVEVFLPTAGTVGIAALLVAVAAVVAAFFHGVVYGSVFLLAIVVAVPFLFAAAVKIWPHTPIGRMILIGDITKENVMPKDSHYVQVADQIGKIGIAKTKMYPSGIVVIDDQRFDAVSKGFPIEEGETVRVVSVQGNRLHVQKHDRQESDHSDSKHPATMDPVGDLNKTMEDFGIEDFEL
jgi:membrane-bound serine protease (ClpP class)